MKNIAELSEIALLAARPFKPVVLNYCSRIRNSLAQHDGSSISIGDVVPGVAFRETYPFQNENVWSPIQPLRLRSDLDEEFQATDAPAKVPRKGHPKFADWLISCFRRTLVLPSLPIHILVVGDGEGDVILTNRLNDLLVNNGRAQAIIYDPARARETSNPNVRWMDSWTLVRSAAMHHTKEHSGDAAFLIVDVDRTLLMPRGACDEDYERFKLKAFSRYVAHFVRREFQERSPGEFWADELLSEGTLAQALDWGATNIHYSTEDDEYHKDEEVRVAAALAWLLVPALERNSLQKHNPIELLKVLLYYLEEANRTPVMQAIDVDKLHREIYLALVEIEVGDPSFFPLYRTYEENAFHELADSHECYLNGYIIDLVAEAVSEVPHRDRPYALPIAYSDRPGNSVGLRLTPNRRARPQRYGNSLMERPLRIWRGRTGGSQRGS